MVANSTKSPNLQAQLSSLEKLESGVTYVCYCSPFVFAYPHPLPLLATSSTHTQRRAWQLVVTVRSSAPSFCHCHAKKRGERERGDRPRLDLPKSDNTAVAARERGRETKLHVMVASRVSRNYLSTRSRHIWLGG